MSTSPDSSRTYQPSVASIDERITAYDPEQNDSDDDQTDDDTFVPASETMADEFEMNVDHDLEEDGGGFEIEFEILGESTTDDAEEEDEGGGRPAEDNQEQRETRPVYLTRNVLRLLGHPDFRQILQTHGIQGWRLSGFDDSDDELSGQGWGRSRRRASQGQIPFEKVPSDVGRDLIWSGSFGNNDRPENTVKRKKQSTGSFIRISYLLPMRI